MAKDKNPQDDKTRRLSKNSHWKDDANAANSASAVESEIESIPPLPTDDAMFHEFMDQEDLATDWIKEYFPDLVEKLDFSKLKIENCEFFNQELRKRVADVVYTVPYKDGTTVLKLTIILEHKGQSSTKQNRATIAQTLVYLAEYCLREALKTDAKTTITQPISVIVYTGLDDKLERIDWQQCFPLPPELQKYGLPFVPEFINMTRLRRQGKLPKNPFLEIMYNIMTRSKRTEFEEYGKTALKPLEQLTGKWTEQEKRRAIELIFFFSSRVKKLRVPNAEEKVAELFNSINLEEKMGKDLLYKVVAPLAEQAGIQKGIVIGEEKGIQKGIVIGEEKGIQKGIVIGEEKGIQKGIVIGEEKGIQKERNSALSSQRARLCSIIKERFNACPDSLRDALNKIFDIETLISLRFYALMRAKSIDDVLEYAENAAQ